MSRSARTKHQVKAVPEPPVTIAPRDRALRTIACVLILAATVAAYWQVGGFDFVTMDDYLYVTHNSHVRSGLSAASIHWAFTGTGAGNWHPLTWLSLMLDYQFSRMNAGPYHVTNLILHLANALLLIMVLSRMTGSFWRSAFVGGLFALHPLHVESVAWVSERKDVLSTLFWMLTMLAYVRYVGGRDGSRPLRGYALVIVLFALGLMAKPMLVTLPIVLMLMDWWPLGRFADSRGAPPSPRPSPSGRGSSGSPSPNPHSPVPVTRYLVDKLPLFALAAVSCVVTVWAQRAGGAVAPLKALPIELRIPNAVVSYVSYLGNTVWPSRLAPFYPHPLLSIPRWEVALSALMLIGATYLAMRLAWSRPYFAFGWLWYLITMVPVIGIVQVGSQAMADRYTYVPLIGIFIIVAWGVPDLLRRVPGSGRVMCAVAGVVLLVVAVRTYDQARHWRNDVTIWSHAALVTSHNSLAHYNLACAYDERKQYDRAIRHYREAVRIDPNKAEAHNNLGNLYLKLGRLDEAERSLREALRAKPNYPEANCNLGLLLDKRKDYATSLRHYAKSLKADPRDQVVRSNYAATECDMGIHLAQQGRAAEAIAHFRKAMEIDPKSASAHYNLAVTLDGQGDLDGAIAEYTQAVRLDPDYADAHNNLGVCLGQKGRYDEAIHHFSEALRVKPDFEKARVSLEHFREMKAQGR